LAKIFLANAIKESCALDRTSILTIRLLAQDPYRVIVDKGKALGYYYMGIESEKSIFL